MCPGLWQAVCYKSELTKHVQQIEFFAPVLIYAHNFTDMCGWGLLLLWWAQNRIIMSYMEYLHFIQEILGDCRRSFSCDDVKETDYINSQLELCNHFLPFHISSMLFLQPASHYDYSLIREFHCCINDLQQIWQLKCATLEGHPATQNEGRPQKHINIELVNVTHIPFSFVPRLDMYIPMYISVCNFVSIILEWRVKRAV